LQKSTSAPLAAVPLPCPSLTKAVRVHAPQRPTTLRPSKALLHGSAPALPAEPAEEWLPAAPPPPPSPSVGRSEPSPPVGEPPCGPAQIHELMDLLVSQPWSSATIAKMVRAIAPTFRGDASIVGPLVCTNDLWIVQRAVEEGRVVTRTAPDEHRAPSPQHRRRVAPVELRGAPRHRRPRVRLQVVPGSDWTATLSGWNQQVLSRPSCSPGCIHSVRRVLGVHRSPRLRSQIVEASRNHSSTDASVWNSSPPNE